MMSAAPDLDMMMERGAMLEESSTSFKSSASRKLKKKNISRAAPQKSAMLRSESPEELCAANVMDMDLEAAPQLDDLCENFASAAPMEMKQAEFFRLEKDEDDDASCESLEEMEKERSAPVMMSKAALASAPAIVEEVKIAEPVKQVNTAIPKATKVKKGKNEIDAQAL